MKSAACRSAWSFSGFVLAAALGVGLPASTSADPVKITIEKSEPRVAPVPAEPPAAAAPFIGVRPAVDLAILLDTSNSMDGLIDQARQQLWTIVGQFAAAKKAGQTPHLRVALFEYGNTNLPASEGYIRQVVPLTDDLDAMSAALFALTTNGGDEYCGQVIDEAITRLDWSKDPNAYRTIFIAGNEPFTQGPILPNEACKRAIEAGVIVNTIHCGNYDAGIQGHWNLGAQIAEGEYLNIDQDRVVVDIPSPHDKIIIELNTKLNATYLWYGEDAEELAINQVVQDRNSFGISESNAVQRIKAKNSAVYRNVGRDLVDSYAADADVLDDVDYEELPEAMQEMTAEQREAYVQEKADERAAIKAQLKEATDQRDAFVAAERERQAAEAAAASGGDATLGDAVLVAIRKQLTTAGFVVEAAE
ncbi:MAG: vWA domain-containing protein [Planctomycetota bacterium]